MEHDLELEKELKFWSEVGVVQFNESLRLNIITWQVRTRARMDDWDLSTELPTVFHHTIAIKRHETDS